MFSCVFVDFPPCLILLLRCFWFLRVRFPSVSDKVFQPSLSPPSLPPLLLLPLLFSSRALRLRVTLLTGFYLFHLLQLNEQESDCLAASAPVLLDLLPGETASVRVEPVRFRDVTDGTGIVHRGVLLVTNFRVASATRRLRQAPNACLDPAAG